MIANQRRRETLNIPKCIYLYDEGIEGVDFRGLKKFVCTNFGSIKFNLVNLKEKVVATRGLLLDFVGTQNNFLALNSLRKWRKSA